MQPSGYQTYKRVQTETAAPGQLIVLLYDALLKNLLRAELGLSEGKPELVHESLLTAQEVVLELTSSLDRSIQPIANQLGELYDYFYRRLVEINLDKQLAPVQELIPMVRQLRDAWVYAAGVAPMGQEMGVRGG